MKLLDGFHDIVGHDGQIHVVESSGGGVSVVGRCGGGVILLVQKWGDDGEDDVEEREETQPDDNGEEEVALEGVAHLDTGVHAKGVASAETGVNSEMKREQKPFLQPPQRNVSCVQRRTKVVSSLFSSLLHVVVLI